MSNDVRGDRIPEFYGDVARYRDWKRAVLVYRTGTETSTRELTGARVLAALRGDAQLSTRHFDPEELRTQGENGFKYIIVFVGQGLRLATGKHP